MSGEVRDELKEVDGITVTTLMDNYVDVLLMNATGVTRPPMAISGKIPADTLLAEHGLSLLVAVTMGERTHHVLFDCGYSKVGLPHNVGMLAIDLGQVEVIERKNPSLIAEDTIAVTGEIERVTDFEKGLPNALVERNGALEPDKILDDQSIVIKRKKKGLVVISGCGHAGIINTILYARKITGIDTIHAVMGGFHLQGPAFEPIVERTIAEFKTIKPEVIVPMHCTGWAAIKRFSEEFPSSFVLNSVGTRISF